MLRLVYQFYIILLATVWLINGLYCKVLNGVPRHAEIVATILGKTYAAPLTMLIGWGEVGLSIWVLSGLFRRWCMVTQIALVLIMNVIEFFVVPHLLLFGKLNLLVACFFVAIVATVEWKKA